MPRATVTFQECIQDSQEYGSSDEHMVSRVRFALEVEGQARGVGQAYLKQVVGADFETGPVEVGAPTFSDYSGPFNHNAFSESAERYYRAQVGSGGRAIRLQGAKNVRMQNNRFIGKMSVEFEIPQG